MKLVSNNIGTNFLTYKKNTKMKKLTQLTTVIIITICLCASFASGAQDGSWALTTGGDYSNPGNWIGGNIADDSTSIAYFTNAITALAVIQLQTNRTLGEDRHALVEREQLISLTQQLLQLQVCSAIWNRQLCKVAYISFCGCHCSRQCINISYQS